MEILKTQLDNSEIIKVEIGQTLEDVTQKISGPIELDIENQAQFVETINSIFDEGQSKVIVDMSLISYIDSSGLWAIFEGHKKATQKNGAMILLNPTKDVQRVLDITKMSSKMKIFASQDEAISSLTE